MFSLKNSSDEKYELLRLLFQWRFTISSVALLTLIASVVFTMPIFIPPVFQSETIIYPSNTNSNKELIENSPRFGSDKEIDEQIQILKSSIVRDSMIRKYHLIKHYDIDTSVFAKRQKIYKQYDGNVVIERNRYNAISIKVYDTDPVIAAAIANDIVKTGDEVKNSIIRSNLQVAFLLLSKQYYEKSKETDSLTEELNKFISKPVSVLVPQKDKNLIERLKDQLEMRQEVEAAKSRNNLKQVELLYYYEYQLQQLSEIQKNYFEASANYSNPVPSSYVISPAEISYKKAYPERLLISILAALGAFLLACASIVLSNKLNKFFRIIQSEKL